jgi:hypothetical protein
MLRALVVVLLAANAVALAWSLGALDGLLGRRPNAEHEPERLQRQVNPELVKLLPPAAASAPASGASPPSSAASSPLMVAAVDAGMCLEAGPFPAAALAGAEKALEAAGLPAGSWTTAAAAPKGVYLIYMGRYEDDEVLQRKLEELKRRRIEARPVRHAELQPGIEVARFDGKGDAEAALAQLSQRGLRTARVLTLAPPQPQLMLRLAAAEPSQAEALATLKLAPAVEGFRPCAPTAAHPVQASASASAGAAVLPAALGAAAAAPPALSGAAVTRPAPSGATVTRPAPSGASATRSLSAAATSTTPGAAIATPVILSNPAGPTSTLGGAAALPGSSAPRPVAARPLAAASGNGGIGGAGAAGPATAVRASSTPAPADAAP